MRKLVSFVFKMMASVVLILMISNVAIVIIDILTVVNRTETVIDLVEATVMKDNYLSSDARQVYVEQLEQIKNNSSHCKGIVLDKDRLLDEVKNYGEFATIKVEMNFETTFLFWSGTGNMNKIANSVKAYNVDIDKEYTVPCLRYLRYKV